LRPRAVPAVVHQDIAGITASPDNSAAMATPPAESANSVTLSARRFQTVHADKAFAVRGVRAPLGAHINIGTTKP
jgi:hypothetical protein